MAFCPNCKMRLSSLQAEFFFWFLSTRHALQGKINDRLMVDYIVIYVEEIKHPTRFRPFRVFRV